MKTFLAFCLFSLAIHAADPVFSGPQPGEKATPFKVLELTGDGAGKERDVNADAATALVFVHGIERSVVPLLRVVDQYGTQRKDRIKTEIVFLSADRLEGEQRAKAASGSLKLQSRIGLSLDGAEGPGNYGLNKECLMTIVTARDGKVAANIALVQPGIADAPKVLEALAKVCGDDAPPGIEQLSGRQVAAERAMQQLAAQRARREPTRGADLTKFDLNTEAGLREAVRALLGEVQSLRAEVAALRTPPGPAETITERPPKDFPGAVPTDEKLSGLLRQFIRPTNDDAAVDNVLDEVRAYIKDNADLRKQAIDGWVRILHFGDRYGTEHARKVGREFLEKLKSEVK